MLMVNAIQFSVRHAPREQHNAYGVIDPIYIYFVFISFHSGDVICI